MLNNEEFVLAWQSYYSGSLLNSKDFRDMSDRMRDFLRQGEWMIMRPMTNEEFDSDKFA